MKKLALISVHNKTGLVDFAKGLFGLGYEIISTGGTSKFLKEHGISVIEISKITGFPEILSGRVKTLHPNIFAGILSRRNIRDRKELKKLKIYEIDIVVVNLYPFEEERTIENIDIGGVSLLRASAKNFENVLVVSDPNDYSKVIEKIKNGKVDLQFRRELAAKALRHTSYYDFLISNYFSKDVSLKFSERITIGFKKISDLRYGENPHQKAAIYQVQCPMSNVQCPKQLQGKELSYNNYLDLDSAWNLVKEFSEPTCAIIKHNNPCGVAYSKNIFDAYKNALVCDPVSAFGGIIVFNRNVDEKTANEITKIFTECIIAPSYSKKALEIFSNKKNLRILKKGDRSNFNGKFEFRSISDGVLIQEKDTKLIDRLKIVTKKRPSKKELKSLLFAWKVAKHVKSNAIVLVKGTETVGIGCGQTSRIDSLKIANVKMNSIRLPSTVYRLPLVLASDGFIPFRDVIDKSAKVKVKAIIQPGGSIRDDEVIKSANEQKLSMVFTGIRHFKH